jgi:hypothetical protein
MYSNMMLRSAKWMYRQTVNLESTIDVQKIKVRYEMKATLHVK